MKKGNKFILYKLRILFIISITIIIFTILTPSILASPINYVPLNDWVYPAISRLETLRAFDGNDTVATNTLPLTRIEVAYLIDTSLSNIQKGKMELKDPDLILMEKLVLEFQYELTSIDVKIISINSDTTTPPPSDNWLYESLNYFAQQENFFSSNLSLSLLSPQMSRKDMAILLDEIIYQIQTEQVPISILTDQDIEKLEALIIELDDELSFQGLKIVRLNKTTIILDNLKSTLKFNPYFTQRVDFHNPGNHSKLSSELGVKASATISENSAFYFDYSFGIDSINPFTSLTNSKINQAYITTSLPSFEIPTPNNTALFPSLNNIDFPSLKLQIGRDSMRWGPAYQGSLILSDNAPAFDMLKYSGTIDLDGLIEGLGKVHFTKFFSLLDTLYEHDRFFLGQRLEYKPTDTLTIGLSETAVISRDPSISTILFYNPLPFIPPYVITRIIANKFGISSVINSYVGIDAELNFQPGIKLYGELMLDDLHFKPEYLYPNRTGFLAGAYFADPLDTGNTDFRIEYTHMNNYVYYHTKSWQDYLYQGEYIGNPLGPDADQIYLEVNHRLSDKFNLSLSYNHERHGEGQVETVFPSDPVVANENIFLSGIIEKQQAYQAEVSYTMSPQWELSAGVTLENIENKDNTIGENEKNTYFQLELDYEF